jgi:dihydroflavonol-4-reductase
MILVTGATGFLGRNLIPFLVEAGCRVRALARPASDTALLAALGVECVTVDDIANREQVASACDGCRSVVHAAGHFRFWGSLPAFWQANVAGTVAMLEAAAAANIERFIHISTVVVIGRTEPGRVVNEAHPCRPLDAYQRTKLEAEQLALAYHRRRALPVVVLRPGAYYGPWGRYAFNRLFFEEPLRGWRIQVHHGQRITFPAFVPDVVQAIWLALERGRAGRIYNIAGEPLSHRAANAIVSDLAGISRRRLNVPAPAVLALARAWTSLSRFTGREPFYPRDMASYVFQDWPVSSALARRELGFLPTPFADGARATLEWYWRERLLARKT